MTKENKIKEEILKEFEEQFQCQVKTKGKNRCNGSSDSIWDFLDKALTRQRKEIIEEILEIIDKDYRGRDITIYELGKEITKLKQ